MVLHFSTSLCFWFFLSLSISLPTAQGNEEKVKLVDERPYLLIGSTWKPICGHYFWNDNVGASIFCKKLGNPLGGKIEKEKNSYNEDAFYVGGCESNSITDLENGCTKHKLVAPHDCKKGRPVSIKIKCGDPLEIDKIEYTNCIKNPDRNGCAKIVSNLLPNLLHENVIKEGQIGVNNGSLSYKGAKQEGYLKSWAATLTLLKIGDVKTIKTDNEKVTINGTVTSRAGTKRYYGHMRSRPTGLYAGPGDLVTVTFPEELVGKVSIDIGHFHFKFSFPVRSAICKIGSPYGGLIIVRMNSQDSYTGEFEVSFTNAIRAPHFIYGKTTNEEWEEMRHFSPKWSVLMVPGQVDIYVQTISIRDITDMEASMSRIRNTMDILEESVGLRAGSKPGAEILILDAARGAPGGYHEGRCSPGTNVCHGKVQYDGQANTNTDYNSFFKEDGTHHCILHEFGHGYCPGDFPNMGSQWTAETVRSYVKYVKGRKELVGIYEDTGKWLSITIPETRSLMIGKDLGFFLLWKMVRFMMDSGGKPCGEIYFEGHFSNCWKWLNWLPEKAHGWKIWKEVNTLDAKSTKHYNSSTDRMVDMYCQATQHNMLPMFNIWNIKPSDEAIAKNCQKLPDSDLITKWTNVAKCVSQYITNGDKDIRECGKMPGFPEHKGLCVVSGYCNGTSTKMNKFFDLNGHTVLRQNWYRWRSTKRVGWSLTNKQICLQKAADYFQSCKNTPFDIHQLITATYYEKDQVNELGYTEVNSTYPPPGPLFISSQLKNAFRIIQNYPAKNCMDGNEDTFCQTGDEVNPFFVIEYAEPIKVTDVIVTVRKDCCWDKAKQMVVTVTNTVPNIGQLASGFQLGETFIGPATFSAQQITFQSETGITGKYVIVQQQSKGVMNLAEVQVNGAELAKCVIQSIKNGYKDIRECQKMPRFPEHKGLCVISGICNRDKNNNDETTIMNNKFYTLFKKTTSVTNETCFQRAAGFLGRCKNNMVQPITATFYEKKQGNKLSYDESYYTYPPPGPSMSSQHSFNYPAKNCMDGRRGTYCHTDDEENPFFLIGYAEPIKVTDVLVTVRKDCCWERAKQMVVIVTNTVPTVGQLASGLQLGETFTGPATHSVQTICFKSYTGITGKYLIVQQQYKGYMNLAEVQVNIGTGQFASARSSSVYQNKIGKYGPVWSINGHISKRRGKFFHSNREKYPWLEMKLRCPTKLSGVTITSCTQDRSWCKALKKIEVRVGRSMVPEGTTSQLLTGNEVCGYYPGPAAKGETIKIICSQPIIAEYITIQLKTRPNNKGFLQINDVGIQYTE